ncbi:hypothetical protein BpHYR1_037363 [Brachionus plicatilis]|uniref:Uncharacterized protein n=1 Tax=Brachionus plicatilis TaxID=10195 RepID=A0A3M7STH4_BRAPC|nr:hypothetical protein BpHYR1_037363 [Brachionus plicatilis]
MVKVLESYGGTISLIKSLSEFEDNRDIIGFLDVSNWHFCTTSICLDMSSLLVLVLSSRSTSIIIVSIDSVSWLSLFRWFIRVRILFLSWFSSLATISSTALRISRTRSSLAPRTLSMLRSTSCTRPISSACRFFNRFICSYFINWLELTLSFSALWISQRLSFRRLKSEREDWLEEPVKSKFWSLSCLFERFAKVKLPDCCNVSSFWVISSAHRQLTSSLIWRGARQ